MIHRSAMLILVKMELHGVFFEIGSLGQVGFFHCEVVEGFRVKKYILKSFLVIFGCLREIYAKPPCTCLNKHNSGSGYECQCVGGYMGANCDIEPLQAKIMG